PAELLFDQMRAVVNDDRRGEGGSLILNAEFLRFAEHWGFRPRACRPYRARTKGKIERPMWRDKQGEKPATIKMRKPKPLSGLEAQRRRGRQERPRRVIAAIPLRLFLPTKEGTPCAGATHNRSPSEALHE